MSIFSRINAASYSGQLLGISDEEARTIILALRRSAQAMPDETETLGSREMRAKREAKLAERLGHML